MVYIFHLSDILIMERTEGEFCVETWPLKPETVKIAEEELRETPERVAEATQKLRELLQADKTLHYRDDDEFLLIFLRPCKFYPESAHKLVSTQKITFEEGSNAIVLQSDTI